MLTREGYHSLIESNEAFEVLAEEKVALSCEEAAKMMQARHNSEIDRAVSTKKANELVIFENESFLQFRKLLNMVRKIWHNFCKLRYIFAF